MSTIDTSMFTKNSVKLLQVIADNGGQYRPFNMEQLAGVIVGIPKGELDNGVLKVATHIAKMTDGAYVELYKGIKASLFEGDNLTDEERLDVASKLVGTVKMLQKLDGLFSKEKLALIMSIPLNTATSA